jgi:poly(3-hydroxyalkanoate) synthetase
MNDPFELWRLLWSTAMSRGLEHLAEAFPTAALSGRGQANSIDLTAFPTFDRVRIELQTMLLLEQRQPARAQEVPVLIVAPYAVHDASIADFASGHSLAHVLADGRSGRIVLTFWKSASPEMRGCGIDAYLSDLNVAIDDLGGRASLVGLCQGGWLAAAFAARFPKKVVKLVLAGAPIDLAAAESQITRTLASVPPATIVQLIALGGGMVSGALSLTFWSDDLLPEFTAEAALQGVGDAALVDKFNAWNERTVDLPGAYFVQTAEWIFRENRLARDCLPALGRLARLSGIEAPIFVLASADDEIVSLPQATAAKSLCRSTKVVVRIESGRHLSLFMGRRTLSTAWRDIAHWLNEADDA